MSDIMNLATTANYFATLALQVEKKIANFRLEGPIKRFRENMI